MRRDLVDKYVYPAKAYGVPDLERFSPSDASKPFHKHLERGDIEINGQVRITVNPDAFFWVRCVRMFTYSADKTFAKNRTAFHKELTAALAAVLSTKEVRRKAAEGIFGGKLPPWWKAEDQLPNSKIATSRLEDDDLK